MAKGEEAKIDVWSKKNACVVCEEVCSTPQAKEEHEQKQTHKKKFSIYKFTKTHLTAKASSSQYPSVLIRRFRLSKEKPAGLECLNELRFPWGQGWWVCSICHESGCTYEQAENHVRSPQHMVKYLDEFAPDKIPALKKLKSNPIEYYMALIKARDELYESEGEYPPEIFELDIEKETATVELVVNTPSPPPKETLTHNLGESDQANTIKRAIIKCTICHEVIPCYRKNLNKVWSIHENTPHHRKASAINGILNHLSYEEVIDDDMEDVSPQLDFQWRRINNAYFGPICGKSFLLSCGSQNFCLLCNCTVNSEQEHFSSEFHILRFLSVKKTQEIITYHQQTGESRRTKMLDLLGKITLDNDSYKKLNCDKIPDPILELGNVERLDVEECMPPLSPFGQDAQCLVCLKCHVAVKVPPADVNRAEVIWNEHVQSPNHFDVLSRQATYYFFDEFFVPTVSTVKSYPTDLNGVWKETSTDPKNSYLVQTQCDVGLEWIVEDQESGEVVCTLCSRTYKKDNADGINNHIRSYFHLNQYLNAHFTDFLAILSTVNSEKAVIDLMMDWLQKTYTSQCPFTYDSTFMQYIALSCNWGKIRVYSPEKAANIAKKMDVLVRTAEMAYVHPSIVEETKVLCELKDKIAGDGLEKLTINLRQALMCSPCRVIYMDDEDNKLSRRWLLKCVACQMVFSSTVENLPVEVFEKHLHDPEHHRRIAELEDFSKDRYRFVENEMSSFTVKQYIQSDTKGKTFAWSYNQEIKDYQFILNVVGLEDMIERKSHTRPEKSPDFFCKTCLLSIPRRKFSLEEHVRSRSHVFNYVQKFYPMTIYDIEKEKLEDAKARNRIAHALKDIPLKVTDQDYYCIPLYDPIGQMQKAAEDAEKQKEVGKKEDSLAVLRKKAEEQRIAKEAQKRKLLEKQKAAKERERAEAMEREKRLKEKADKAEEDMKRFKEDLQKRTQAQVQEAAERARAFAILQANKQIIEDQVIKQTKERALAQEKERIRAMEMARLKELKAKEEALLKEKQRAEAKNIAQKTQDLLNKVRVPGGQHSSYLQVNLPPMNVLPPKMLDDLNKYNTKPSSYVNTLLQGQTYPNSKVDIPRKEERSHRWDQGVAFRNRSRSKSRSPRRDYHRSRSPEVRRGRSPTRERIWSSSQLKDISPLYDSDIRTPRDSDMLLRTYSDSQREARPSLRHKTVDPIINDPLQITNRVSLVEYIWKAGAEKIPVNERPHLYSEVAAKTPGHIGIDKIFEVVCLDDPLLDTFYCSLCGFWNTPSEILKHLDANEHKLAYMYRYESIIHERVNAELIPINRARVLGEEAINVWRTRPKETQEINCRLRTYLNKATINRVWPEHVLNLDHSWKNQPERVQVPAPVSKDAFGFNYIGQTLPTVDLTRILTQPSVPIFNPNMPPPPMAQSMPGMGLPLQPLAAQYPVQPVHISQVHKLSSLPQVNLSAPPPVVQEQPKNRSRSRSPKALRKRSRSRERSRERRRSPSPRRRDHSREGRGRSPVPKRGRTPLRDRDDRLRDRDERGGRRRSRSRTRDDRRRSRSRDRGYKKDEPGVVNKEDISWISDTERFLQKNSYNPQERSHPYAYNPSQPPPQKATEAVTIADIPTRDDNYRRRVMALVCNLQDEVAKNGGQVSPEKIQKIYSELGLSQNDKEVEKTLKTIVQSNERGAKKTINLAEFGIGTPSTSQTPAFQSFTYPPPQQNYPQQPVDNPDLQRILGGIKSSIAQIIPDRSTSPIIKPIPYNFGRTEDFFGDTNLNLTYPDNKEDLEREKNDKLKKKKALCENLEVAMNLLNARKEAMAANMADEDGDDDDWEGLETELGNILAKKTEQPKEAAKEEPPKSQVIRPSFGVPNSWAQPVPQPVKQTPIPVHNVQEHTPIAPGQKIPLQRTILPNGKAISQPASSAPGTGYTPSITQIQTNSSTTYYQSQPVYQQHIPMQTQPQNYSYNQPQPGYQPVYQQQYYPPPQNFSNPPPNFPGQYNIPPPIPGLAPPGTQPGPPGVGGGYAGSYQGGYARY